MIRYCALVAAFLLLAPPVYAQTAAEIQAMEIAAAAQYHVPIQMFQDVIYGESSNNPNIGCNSAGACGIAQFIPATAKEYGVNVNDAQSSINGAAHYLSDLQAQKGSWDAALTAYSGGCSASNPCNTPYAAAHQVAQSADNGTLTADQTVPLTDGTATVTNSDGSTTTMGTLSTPGSSVVSVTTGSSWHAYQWTWNQYQNGVGSKLQSMTSQLQNSAFGLVGSLIVLALAISLVQILIPSRGWDQFWSRMIRSAMVVLLLGAMSLYSNYIAAAFYAFPSWVADGLGLPSPGAGAFDQICVKFLNTATSIAHSLSAWDFGLELLGLGFLFASSLITYGVVFFMFLVWFGAQALGAVCLLVGPILALSLLSDQTRHIWDSFLSVLIGLALVAATSIILAALTLNSMLSGLSGLPTDGVGGAAALLGASFGIGVLGCITVAVPFVLERIAAGAGIYTLFAPATAAVSSTATGAAAVGATALGGAAAATGITRMTEAVGSSLSRG